MIGPTLQLEELRILLFGDTPLFARANVSILGSVVCEKHAEPRNYPR